MERRELGIDLARGVAVVSMFVAHTAPGGGPAGVLQLTEFLTFPLFAMLVGIGAELGRRRSTLAQHAVASTVRAAVLVGLGWALAEAGAHVVIVLAPLGVLTLLCWGLSRLPAVALLAVALLSWLVAPGSVTLGEGWRTAALVDGDEWRLRLLDLVVSPFYPQAVLVVAAAAGIGLVRVLLPQRRPAPPARVPALLAGALLTGCGMLLAAARLDRVSLVAYDTTWLEQLFVVALAAGVVAAGLALDTARVATVLRPLAWVGGMTLTLYVGQILWLAWWVRGLPPGQSDDTWVNVSLLIVGSVVLATAWRALDLPGPARRGPLEGAVGTLVRRVEAPLGPRPAPIPSTPAAEVP